MTGALAANRRQRLWLRLAPVLFAMGFVLTVFADSGSALEALPRPLVIAAVGAFVLEAAAAAVLRSWDRGALVALVLLIFLVEPLVGITAALIVITVALVARRRGFSAAPFAQGAGVIIAIVLTIATGRALLSPGFNLGDLWRHGPAVGAASETAGKPDIFLLMLDGYPRSDTLEAWGYDNSWFTDALQERGFDVASRSHTNYPMTALVLPTTFHMRHVHEIDELRDVPEEVLVQRRALRNSLDETPALRHLGELGYVTVSAGRPADYITLNTNRYPDEGWLNEFEHQVLARTALSGVSVPLILDARRGEVLATLEATATVAADPATTFMFAHVVNPHLPFLFDRNGEQPVMECRACTFATYIDHSGMSRSAFLDAYADQVHHLNGLVIETLDRILASSPDAAVIVFSDHGSRASREPDADWFATFFASRTPGHAGVFPDDARPIEIFPRLFGAYFDDELPIPPNEDYVAPQGVQMPLDIVRHRP